MTDFVPGPTAARRLALALRAAMPDDFVWDFGTIFSKDDGVSICDPGLEPDCRTFGCAMGLAHVLWPEANADLLNYCNLAHEAFGMPRDVFDAIFYGYGPEQGAPERYTYGGKPHSRVTPAMVADSIDRWLVDQGHPTSLDAAP